MNIYHITLKISILSTIFLLDFETLLMLDKHVEFIFFIVLASNNTEAVVHRQTMALQWIHFSDSEPFLIHFNDSLKIPQV